MPDPIDNSATRIWKALDNITDKLANIEAQLSNIVRLEERMNSHDSAIMRYGKRLDTHDNRIHSMELWQANHGDKASTEQLISRIQTESTNLETKIDVLESHRDVVAGETKLIRVILKWISAIIAGLLIWNITRK